MTLALRRQPLPGKDEQTRQEGNGMHDEIYDWKWDGVSIDAIESFAASYQLSLLDLYEGYFPEGWPDSVPGSYRGLVLGPVFGRNVCSPEGYKRFMRILAIDHGGNALTLEGATDIYRGADGYNVLKKDSREAMGLADVYRLYPQS
ncbi:hypothetical protein [Pseudomonas syringae]|nr:hypothetical protein [Pseudomonas syringae]MDU8389557.1 hypothetical protein [Pseudomonas syringae pv. actinidiae]MDU8395073.1 hypothetical protein [Pseudomonas syringae pv. actinidiae]MDU8441611.1 hypothetical protein [Pseudomonas syringae pv. actinidiae]MDU8475760.1 hypothetical protein [Pseudomonas syringae pv. actinidiae]